MKATDAYRRINNSPIRGIVLYYTEQVLQSQKVPLKTVISEIQTGKTPPKSNSKYYSSNDIDWFKPSDIGFEKYLNNAKEKFAQIALDEKKGTLYPKDTLLLIGIGGGVGRVSILKEAGSSNQQITGLTFNNDVSSEYAYYYYLVREDYIKSQAKSMSFPILNQTKIKGLKISYPSIEEQNEFVRFVDYCWSSYLKDEIPNVSDFNVDDKLKTYTLTQFKAIELDSKIKANIAYQKQQLTNLKQAILQEAIQGKLTQEWRAENPNAEPASELLKRIKAVKEKLIKDKKIRKEKLLTQITEEEIPFELPKSWTWSRIGDISENKTGNSINKQLKESKYNAINDGLAYIGTKDVPFSMGSINYDTGVKIPIKETENQFKIAEKKSVFICIEGGSSGKKIGFIEKNVCYGNKLLACTPFVKEISKYFYYLFYSKHFQNEFKEHSKGLRGGVSVNSFKHIKIPVPPFDELIEIVRKIEILMQKCNELELEITQSEQHANMLMQAVLKEAFEGKTENKEEYANA